MLSASLGLKDADWNFRIFAQRTVIVKAKNVSGKKLVANDVLSKTPLTIEVPEDVPTEFVGVEKEYLASFNVYTLRNSAGIDKGYIEFFEVLDVDQSVEDFLRVYWIYPNHIKFVLAQIEPT